MAKEKKKRSNRVRLEIIICLVISILVVLLTQFVSIGPVEQLKATLIDQRFSERGKIELGDTTVIIVEITQETYDEIPEPYNSWPFPRSVFAKLIENLTEAGVKAIGIDIIMSNQDKFSPINDSLMLHAIKQSGRVVVAGKLDIEREALIEKYSIIEEGNKNQGGVIKKQNENYNNIFFQADSSIGIVQMSSDNDGVNRRYLPYISSRVTKQRIPSFGFAVLNKYFENNPFYIASSRDDHFLYNEIKIPKYDDFSVLINYYGPDRMFPRYKMIDIIDDKEFKTTSEVELETDLNAWDDPDFGLLHSGVFKNKIVLIGSTMPEDKDLMAVSFGKGDREGDNIMYGVEVHANAVQNILSGDFLSKQSLLSEIFLTFILTFISFYTSSYIRRIKKFRSGVTELITTVFGLIFLFMIYKIGIYFFVHHNLITAIISPAGAVIMGHFGNTAFHFLQERKQNVIIKGMFSTYVSGHLVNELIANPDKLQLGGVKKNLSILFSDIAGFTTFSEGREPEELVSFINEFLDEMSEIILKNQGTLDKYLGDAVMAFWGAPLPIKNHAFYACKTALEMNEKLHELQKEWGTKGKQPISMRIGVHSGDVVVGNIGGKKRFDYTVMGDSVNLASRLEGANKAYGTSIMISESTYKKVEDKFLVRELDNLLVKGKKKPTKVFELLGSSEDEEAREKINDLKYYFEALESYKKREFSKAMELFKSSLKQIKKDGPSQVYLERTQFYLENPPPEDWNGVFVMKTK